MKIGFRFSRNDETPSENSGDKDEDIISARSNSNCVSKKVDVERLVASTKLKSELNYNNESKSKLSNNNRTNGKINGPKKLPKKKLLRKHQ